VPRKSHRPDNLARLQTVSVGHRARSSSTVRFSRLINGHSTGKLPLALGKGLVDVGGLR
jgi:hypothetical protein